MGGGKDGRKGVLFLELRDPKNYSSSLKKMIGRRITHFHFGSPVPVHGSRGVGGFKQFLFEMFHPEKVGEM